MMPRRDRSRPARSRARALSLTGGALLATACLAAAGCFGDQAGRQEKLRTAARWQDERLAPQDSLAALLADGDAHVRLAAVRAAGLIGRDDVLPQMLERLRDASLAVRVETVWSLGLVGGPQVVPALEAAATDARPAVRHAALAALAQAPNRGRALLAAAGRADAKEAALAWDGLRNMAERVNRQDLLTAIRAGLARPEADVRWRVLRCIELAPDSTLTDSVAPFAGADQTQVRVHAYRALARLDNAAALAALLKGCDTHDRFRGRDGARVRIAGCRALGVLGRHALADTAAAQTGGGDPGRTALLLTMAGGSDDPHVAATALAAMARMVDEAPLPAEAAAQESLLPVWRIRLARAARAHLGRPQAAIRAAALTAYAALRGAGSADTLVAALDGEASPQVLAAALRAISRQHPDPAALLVHYAEIDFPSDFGETAGPVLRNAMVREAAYEGLAFLLRERPEAVPGAAASRLESHLYSGCADEDFVIATSTARLVGDFPCSGSLTALLRLWRRAAGPDRFEMQRGALAGLEKMLNTGQVVWQAPDSLRAQAAAVLRQSFDSPDIRLRLAGRQAAVATGLLPRELIPTEPSLRATLPGVVRDPRQAPLTLPFDAPRVRCVTPRGTFVIELDGRTAPNTCAVILDLIGQGYYDDLTFHRVVPDFVVQGGDPRGDGWGGPGYMIRSEWSRTPYERAVVGIAHDGKDTGGSQFFVTLSEQPHLNGRYTVFGRVSKGMETVDLIQMGDHFRLELMP